MEDQAEFSSLTQENIVSLQDCKPMVRQHINNILGSCLSTNFISSHEFSYKS